MPRGMFEHLQVRKKSMDLVTRVYRLSKCFPSEERFGLTNQVRRASVSVPSNIAEGAARSSDKHFIQYLETALGSSFEIITQLNISINLCYSEDEAVTLGLIQDYKHLTNMIYKLIDSLR